MHLGNHLGAHLGGLLGSASGAGPSSPVTPFQVPVIKSAEVLDVRPVIRSRRG